MAKTFFVSIIVLLSAACSIQQLAQTSPEPTPIDEDDYIADESSVGIEYTARDILNKGETFTPNKVYFVDEKIKAADLKTTKDSWNLQQQDKYRRDDQRYLLGFFDSYLKDNRFSLICSPVKYGFFGKPSIKDEDGKRLEEYLFSIFEGSKLIGVMLKAQNHDLSKKCLKYRKKTAMYEKKTKAKEKDKSKSTDKSDIKKKQKTDSKKKKDSKEGNKEADDKFEEEQRKSSIFN